MQANYVQRLQLSFSKKDAARYIGHLDLARVLERAFNRVKLPIAYTQGFNPHPRMQMATALPLGTISEHEIADIWMATAMEPEAAQQLIMSKMAPGIDVYRVEDVPLKGRALQMRTISSDYKVELLDAVDVEVLNGRITTLLNADSHIRVRARGKKRKEYDLRPLINSLTFAENEGEHGVLHMNLSLMPAKTGRPDELLLALELDPLAARIHRLHIEMEE